VTQTKLINRFAKGVADYVRDKAIGNLTRTGRVVCEKETKKNAGRPTTVYRMPYKKE